MTDIFISYAREDEAQAAELATFLTVQGFEVWWDKRLLAGAHFSTAIYERLVQAKAVIVIWSKTSIASDWVREEAEEARVRQKLVPVMLDASIEPPFGYRAYQHIAFGERGRLLEALKARSVLPQVDLIEIPEGVFQRTLDQRQIDHVVGQFKRLRLSLDFSNVRQTLDVGGPTTVHLPRYRLSRTLVTNRQFATFVKAKSYVTDAERANNNDTWRAKVTEMTMDHPVVNVSYTDAEVFCDWAGRRLPSAPEWQKACRGGGLIGRIYPWGDDFDPEKCNTAESQRGFETTTVDRFPQGAGPYGCLDLVGNVEEWTASAHDNHQLIVGGSWRMSCIVYGLPVLHRIARKNFISNDLGFRVAE